MELCQQEVTCKLDERHLNNLKFVKYTHSFVAVFD